VTETPSDSPADGDAPGAPPSPLLDALAGWLLLASFAHLMHLAGWPLYVFGTQLSLLGKLLVALARLGIYAGLAWGLLTRQRTAWAGTVVELARTFLCFVATARLQEATLNSATYPAGWAQCLLAGALPVVLLANAGLAAGWRPGSWLDFAVGVSARLLGPLTGLAALWLQRQGEAFAANGPADWKTLLRDGLPFALALSACEGAALLLAR